MLASQCLNNLINIVSWQHCVANTFTSSLTVYEILLIEMADSRSSVVGLYSVK